MQTGGGLQAHLCVLGIAVDARLAALTPSDLKAAYQRSVREAHPDRGGTAERFVAVQTSYQALCAAWDDRVLTHPSLFGATSLGGSPAGGDMFGCLAAMRRFTSTIPAVATYRPRNQALSTTSGGVSKAKQKRLKARQRSELALVRARHAQELADIKRIHSRELDELHTESAPQPTRAA